jgi:ketosteroid isomerase-like protein
VTLVVFAFFLILEPSDASAQSDDEEAVKNHVENFLAALGDGNLDAIPQMFVPDANIGTARMHNGSWITSTKTFAEWMASLRKRTSWNRYSEPVSEYTVHVEDSMMAFVRADATIVSDGHARSRNIDYFTLVREDGVWKFLSASYVAKPVESE